jgi:hypothetical protein
MHVNWRGHRKTTVLEGGLARSLRELLSLTKKYKWLRGIDGRSWRRRTRRGFFRLRVAHLYDLGVGERRNARRPSTIYCISEGIYLQHLRGTLISFYLDAEAVFSPFTFCECNVEPVDHSRSICILNAVRGCIGLWGRTHRCSLYRQALGDIQLKLEIVDGAFASQGHGYLGVTLPCKDPTSNARSNFGLEEEAWTILRDGCENACKPQ